MRRRRAGAALIVAALLTTACSGTGADDPSSNGSDVADAAGETAPLSFSATTLSGPDLDVSTLDGQGIVLWFWAPWCTICRVEAPDVAAVAAELQGDVTFLGVPGLGETSDMRAFVDSTGTDGLQHLVDSDGSLWQRFGVVSQPSFVFVTSEGETELFGGALGADELRARASSLTSG